MRDSQGQIAPASGGLDPRELFWQLHALPETHPLAGARPDRCLLCEAGGLRVAIPIEYLRGIEPFAAVTPLPRAPVWVAGVTNVRGTVVGVVDLACFLGVGETAAVPTTAPEGASRTRMLICGSGTRLVAFLVTSTPSVSDYTPAALMPARGIRGRVGRYVAGLLPLDGTAVPLLDLGSLLADEELVNG